jgi:hypothetical protein
MNVHAIAFALLFQARRGISIMHWSMHSLALQLTPVITAYLERGSVAAVSIAAAWVAQSARKQMASQALSRLLHQSHGYREAA